MFAKNKYLTQYFKDKAAFSDKKDSGLFNAGK